LCDYLLSCGSGGMTDQGNGVAVNKPGAPVHRGAKGAGAKRPSGSPAVAGSDKGAARAGSSGRNASGGNVSGALRLGWQLAEVRGRCRVVVPPGDVEPSLASRQLPLTAAEERTAGSSTIEATMVLVSVARRMNVDFGLDRLVHRTPVDQMMVQAIARLGAWDGSGGPDDDHPSDAPGEAGTSSNGDKAVHQDDPTDSGPDPGSDNGDQADDPQSIIATSAGPTTVTVTTTIRTGTPLRSAGAGDGARPGHWPTSPGADGRIPGKAPADQVGAAAWETTDLLRYLVCLVLFQRLAAEVPAASQGDVADSAVEDGTKAKVRIAEALDVDLAVALWAAGAASGDPVNAIAAPEVAVNLVAALTDLDNDEPAPSSPPGPPAWKLLQTMMFRWDEAIQDRLAQGTFGVSSAYQLGRGLAESYWALDISAEVPPAERAGSWLFLFGERRATTFATLCDRLAGPIDGRTTEAIKFGVQAWHDWVSDSFGPNRKAGRKTLPTVGQQASASVDLYNQVVVWRDLLLTGRDPTSYVDPDSLLIALASPRLLLKSFRTELVTATAGAAALVLAIPAFNGWGAKLVTALGAVGITSSALGATAKKNAQEVGTQLKAAVDQQAINQAVLRPRPPDRSQVAALTLAVGRGLRGAWNTWFEKRDPPPPDSPFKRPDNLNRPMARVLPGST
jgi:hypothetical protein